MSLFARILFAPIWVPFWVLDRVVTVMSPRNAAIIAGARDDLLRHIGRAKVPDYVDHEQACEITRHCNDDLIDLWTEFWDETNAKENDR